MGNIWSIIFDLYFKNNSRTKYFFFQSKNNQSFKQKDNSTPNSYAFKNYYEIFLHSIIFSYIVMHRTKNKLLQKRNPKDKSERIF